MARQEVDDCIRRRVEIGGQNFYLMVGKRFVDCTVPHENRPESLELREIVETLCREITEIMEEGDDDRE